MSVRRVMVALALAGLVAGAVAGPVEAGGDWNDGQMGWQPYEQGLAAAKKAKKPICLVFYTEWCPHCTNYSGVFHDPRVVERAKQFVMIRVENDKDPAVSQKYVPDGAYIPRTFFLTSDGTLDPEIHAPRDKFRYFYDEKDAASVLAGMDQALKKLH